MEFDYIIAGGGSSGCVLANRLSADPRNRVCLIESGRRDRDPFIHIPATFVRVIRKGRDIATYVGRPDPGVNGRPSVVIQGHVLGGGSSVNAMVYIRGDASDYDAWAQLGNRGWSYDDVLPVFRDLENNAGIADGYHGRTGELHVSDPEYRHPLSEAFLAAARASGLPGNRDFNGARLEGVGYYQTTTHRGRRTSAARAFLRPAERRPNLEVLTSARVAGIRFDGRRATGVRLEDGRQLAARGEVILCAGAIETPRLLQLSGVGPGAHLAEHGIAAVSDLPGVGENYQDHLATSVNGETRAPISLYGEDRGPRALRHLLRYLWDRGGVMGSNVVSCGGFADVSGAGLPDIQFHVLPVLTGWVDRPALECHGIAIEPNFLRPKSRGSVHLRSADFRDKALFDAGSFRDSDDLEVLVRGLEKAIEILGTRPLADLVARRRLPEPGLERDPDALRDFVRQTAKTVYHPVGTARMGPDGDAMAVLTGDLKVRGTEGLRVADASAMPLLVSGNTNAPTMMIAERAARFILGRETAA